jgi:hypothetical protein
MAMFSMSTLASRPPARIPARDDDTRAGMLASVSGTAMTATHGGIKDIDGLHAADAAFARRTTR